MHVRVRVGDVAFLLRNSHEQKVRKLESEKRWGKVALGRYVDSSELFQKVSNGEKIFVEGLKDSIPGFSITFQDDEDMFIKEDNAVYVQNITVDEFKKKLDSIYRSTESLNQFYSIHDTIKDIILKDLILEDKERMQLKGIWKDKQAYDR